MAEKASNQEAPQTPVKIRLAQLITDNDEA